jgi:large conductance mechanosensitive channel
LLKGFRDFVLRGNVIDLAIAVIIGIAFGAVVTALVTDLLTPLIAAIGGKPDFNALTFTINDSTFRYGHFINQVIAFIIIAAAIYFLVVIPVNKLMKRYKPSPDEPEPVTECPHCFSQIPQRATKCAFCTADLGAAV